MGGLSASQDTAPSRRKSKKPDKTPAWERARSFTQDKNDKRALPVIQQDGKVQRTRPQKPKFKAKALRKRKVSDDNLANGDDNNSESAQPTQPVRDLSETAKHPRKRRKIKRSLENYAKKFDDFEAVKTNIAAIASRILAKPEENVAMLKQLRQMFHALKGKSAALVILTESQIFKDIVPAYKIRAITEKEAEVKVSKDVAKLRAYEQALLSGYHRFVQSCINHSRWRSGGAKETEATRNMGKVRLAACRALAQLIQALPHFNEADTIATCVCNLVADREESVRRQSADALKVVLGDAHRASGQTLNICVLIAKQLASVAVTKIQITPAEVVEPLAEIQFTRFAKLPVSTKAKNAPKRSKRFIKKRRRKPEKEETLVDETEIERDLREADAEATPEEVYNAKKKLLDFVCHCYFNVIKAASKNAGVQEDAKKNGSRRKKAPLALSPALKGLLRVSSFISTDVIEAILGALAPLLETRSLPPIIRFRCLSAAYAILGMHSKTVQADPDSFTGDTRAMDVSLYSAIGNLYGTDTPAKDHEYITFDAMEAMLSCISFREVPIVRSTAIGRRLSILAASSAPTHTCTIGLLRCAQIMLQPPLVSPIYIQTADKTNEDNLGIESGLVQDFDMNTDDPEIANAERSVAWELSCLLSHFHPAVREIARLVAGGFCGSRLPKVSEDIILAAKAYQSSKGGFNPPPKDKLVSIRKSAKQLRSLAKDAVLQSVYSSESEILRFADSDNEAPTAWLESSWNGN